MLQIAQLESYDKTQIPQLYDLVKPILDKRVRLHKRYSRGANDRTLLYSPTNDTTKLPYEKFLVDLASGYLSGVPSYNVNANRDEELAKLEKKLFGSIAKDDDYLKGMQLVIKHTCSYNDDPQEQYDLIHDILELTSCYEVIYETKDEASGKNEIVYSNFSPLQTVATWDYSIPANLTGFIRIWEEKDVNGNIVSKIELTDKHSIRVYDMNTKKEIIGESQVPHGWGDVPGFAIETDYAIFEPCEDVIMAYEQLIQNVRNTYQYNDTDCKLKVVGYAPDEPLTTTDSDGNIIINQARLKEDQAWMDAKTIYVGENGDVSWLAKPVDADGFEKTIKLYENLMFQLAGVPNTSDLAFNSTDLNTSAIDRKFYIMNMFTSSIMSLVKKALLRRWELIFNRINLKNSTNYDFRDIVVECPRNLPANDDELIASMLKLKGTISEQTIVTKLGYDYNVEKQFMEEETEEKIITNIENMQMMRNSGMENDDIQQNSLFNHYDTSQKGVDNEMDSNGQNPQVDLEGN